MITRDLFTENFNGEYDDEAGMARTNLVTIARAAEGLLNTIDDQENLPEWVQEKIAKVQGMMVTAWDYLESQEAQGIDPRQGVAEGNTEVKDATGKVVSWRNDTEWHKAEKNKQGQPKDPRGVVTHLSDVARRKTASQQGVAEEKIEGVDGKACWPGKRYAGKVQKADGSYKDKCVPVKGMTEDKPRFDPLVAKIAAKMKGPTENDAIAALITVLGTSAYNERPGFYRLWIDQAIDKYSKEGVVEGKSDYNFDIEDLKRLERIRDLPTLKAQALALISKPSAKPMKPEKVEWFKSALENMNSPIKVIKLMYDLMLSGEGHAVVGSRSSMNPNSYRQKFGEQGMTEMGEAVIPDPKYDHEPPAQESDPIPDDESVAEGSLKNKYSNLSNRGVNRGIKRAGDDFNRLLDLDQAQSPHYKTQHQQATTQRLKTNPMAGPKGQLPEQGMAEGWKEESQDLEDWSKEVNMRLYRAHESQRPALARQLSKVEQKNFGSNLNQGSLTELVHSALKAIQKGQMVHYDPQSVGQMPFGSMVGDDARIMAAAGVSSDELVGYRMLSDKGIVDNIKQFLQLRRVVWNKNWPQEYLDKFEGRPGALWLQFVKDLGWSKDDMNEEVQAKTDDKLLAYYAQRKAKKQQQGATATSQPVESQTRPSSFQAKPMSMSLEDWKKEILAKYPNARFATERRPNGSTLAGELGGGHGQGGLGIYSPSTGEVRVGPTGAPSQPLRIHPKQQGMAEGEKIGNMDAGAYDSAMARLKQLAGSGPMKTVYDPNTRRYKNVRSLRAVC